MDTVKFGAFLKELRKEQGLTQEQLAEKMKVSNRTVSRWETGANVPDLDILIELSEFYQIDLKDLLMGERQTAGDSESDAQFAQEVAQYQAIKETKRMRLLFYCILLEIIVMLGLLIVTAILLTDIIGGIMIPSFLVIALLIYSLIMPGLQKQDSALSYRLTLNGGFLATIISNIVILIVLFYEGEYHNYGLAMFLFALIIIAVIFSVAIIATVGIICPERMPFLRSAKILISQLLSKIKSFGTNKKLYKKVPFFVLLSVVAIVSIILAYSVFPLYTNASKYMQLSKESRIEYAQKRYEEFTNHPDKEFEVLISFKMTWYSDIIALLSNQGNMITAFYCFERFGEYAGGGYTECEGKDAKQVFENYYDNIYNSVVGQVEFYDEYIESLKESFEYDEEVSTGPNIALETALNDAEQALAQYIAQKEAMEHGGFHIYGVRLVMTGAEIESILRSDLVGLVEILDFDNNDLLTPIK